MEIYFLEQSFGQATNSVRPELQTASTNVKPSALRSNCFTNFLHLQFVLCMRN